MSAIGAIIGGVAALGGAALGASASGSAASAEEKAAQQQLNFEEGEFSALMANAAPFMQSGQLALNALTAGFAPGGQFTQGFNPGTFANSPEYAGYLFQQTQGQSGIKGSAAAGGAGTAGTSGGTGVATSEALMGFNQGLAETSYQNWYQMAYQQWLQQQQTQIGGLQNLANLGENATVLQGNAGATTAGLVSSSLAQGGNAAAAGKIGQASAISGGLTGGFNSAMMGQLIENSLNNNNSGNFTAQDLATFAASQNSPAQTTGLMPAGGGYTYNTPGATAPVDTSTNF